MLKNPLDPTEYTDNTCITSDFKEKFFCHFVVNSQSEGNGLIQPKSY